MDAAEKMAADIALTMNGGEWKDGKWYSKGHREAWIKAVQPYADEIERLREIIDKQMVKEFADRWANHILYDQPKTPQGFPSLLDALKGKKNEN